MLIDEAGMSMSAIGKLIYLNGSQALVAFPQKFSHIPQVPMETTKGKDESLTLAWIQVEHLKASPTVPDFEHDFVWGGPDDLRAHLNVGTFVDVGAPPINRMSDQLVQLRFERRARREPKVYGRRSRVETWFVN